MNIVADENIPFLNRFFNEIGEIKKFPGRSIKPEHLADAKILIVRSVTDVNETLLRDSAVKFVGSCTIGMDHIDTDYLDSRAITYANAPGCNANSVVEYVLSCLSILTETHNFDWDKQTVGILGYGNVGRLLAKRLKKMGIPCKACDPLLDQEQHGLVSFDDVMACDVVSLHVPLTLNGDHATHHLINDAVFSKFEATQILINASRGAVVDNQALKRKLIESESFTAILDVWENEPGIDVELAKRVFLGSPHIAGYSLDGKVAGTEMVYQALCKFLGFPQRHKAGQFLDEPPLSKMAFTSMADPGWCVHTAIRACFDVRHDHGLLRSSLSLSESERRAAFDLFRKNYRCRREFSGVKIQLKKVESELHRKFKALGFNLKS